ncbi:FmdB family zinc ribbon protein [Pseudonocardia sp. ICBG601]|uniref:FmdB family zinc ribbon protein n=1 Tax=Pseudonocardia sp. ICBG601 TaxID=2846759 RepID=UPI0015BAAE92|nr:FmdB family zinc ribbon protein [Pseudonocardia sp. ICBG601]NWJ71444.1 FmdB family transcriptional regulator [Pseudonocardia pini]NWJ71458.1 FmdB family transcriptional regulator [Pseudonocardia pini]NWJ71471.1 FmdB family transcriptional regulator [Pseudonocardia pini]
MPTYQYACTACDHRFEAVQSFSDDALSTCPNCGGKLRKVFSSVGIVFKGSGFYRTDSRSGSVSSGSGSSSESAKSDSSSSSSSSSDSSSSSSSSSSSDSSSSSSSSSSAGTSSSKAAAS